MQVKQALKAAGFAAALLSTSVATVGTAEASTHPSLTQGNPVDCPSARTVKTHVSSTSGNTYEARYSAACDGVWTRMSNETILEDTYVFIVAYDCVEATGSCRSQYSERAISTTGGWTRMLDVSDHDAFRVCWDDETEAPFEACGNSFTIDSPRDFESWNGNLSRPEGHSPEFTVNWTDDYVCVIPESAGTLDIRIDTWSEGEGRSRTYHTWNGISIIDDYFCESAGNRTHSEVWACNGRACGFGPGLERDD